MAHYECRRCGEWGCFGECMDPPTPQDTQLKHDTRMAGFQRILEEEHLRLTAIDEARRELTKAGRYNHDRYDHMFKGSSSGTN